MVDILTEPQAPQPPRRFSRTQGPSDEDILLDGVPPHLVNSLWRWYEQMVVSTSAQGARRIHQDHLDRIEQVTERSFTFTGNPEFRLQYHREAVFADPEFFLRSIDVLLDILQKPLDTQGKARAEQLNDLLRLGRSKWQVIITTNEAYLAERVGPEMQKMVEGIRATNTSYAMRLDEAWKHIYGQKIQPDQAVSSAIKAVEGAMWPIVEPNNQKATLGTMLGLLRGQPSLWVFSIPNLLNPTKPHETLVSDLELLWEGQTNRHETGRHTRPNEPDEARFLVLHATKLVEWLRTGALARKDNNSQS